MDLPVDNQYIDITFNKPHYDKYGCRNGTVVATMLGWYDSSDGLFRIPTGGWAWFTWSDGITTWAPIGFSGYKLPASDIISWQPTKAPQFEID